MVKKILMGVGLLASIGLLSIIGFYLTLYGGFSLDRVTEFKWEDILAYISLTIGFILLGPMLLSTQLLVNIGHLPDKNGYTDSIILIFAQIGAYLLIYYLIYIIYRKIKGGSNE